MEASPQDEPTPEQLAAHRDRVARAEYALRRGFEIHDPKADPFGFAEMSISELRRWMAERNAEPGSQRYEHCRLILEDKVDQRDFRIKVAQIAAATLVGLAAIVVSIALGL